MFDGASSQRHRLRLPIEPTLHCLQDRFMLPACDAAIVARGAARFEWAPWTCRWPVLVDGQAVLHRREAVDGTFARRTLVLVILGDVDEVRLAEATLRLGIGGHRLGHQRRDAGL